MEIMYNKLYFQDHRVIIKTKTPFKYAVNIKHKYIKPVIYSILSTYLIHLFVF